MAYIKTNIKNGYLRHSNRSSLKRDSKTKGVWIGRGDPMSWSPTLHSPNVTPLDLFHMGLCKKIRDREYKSQLM